MSSHLSRRAVLLSALATAGCSTPLRDTPLYGTILRGSGLVRAPDPGAEYRAYADKLPYASLAVSLRGTPQALLVLATIDADGSLNWISGAGQTLSTFGPFVTRLIGMDIELRATALGTRETDLRSMIGRGFGRQVTYHADRRIESAFESQFEADGLETIDVFGVSHETRRIVEQVVVDGRARFSNRYWIDSRTGFCWRSRQRVIPTEAPFEIAVLKPPAIG